MKQLVIPKANVNNPESIVYAVLFVQSKVYRFNLV